MSDEYIAKPSAESPAIFIICSKSTPDAAKTPAKISALSPVLNPDNALLNNPTLVTPVEAPRVLSNELPYAPRAAYGLVKLLASISSAIEFNATDLLYCLCLASNCAISSGVKLDVASASEYCFGVKFVPENDNAPPPLVTNN